MEMCGQGLSPGSKCTRPQIIHLSEKLHRYNVHTKTFNPKFKSVKHERSYIGEQACTGNEFCIVFFIRYSQLGHKEVIYADQKLNRYTECENTSKKTSMSSRFTKKFILGRILIDRNEFAKFLNQFLQQATHQTIHIRNK